MYHGYSKGDLVTIGRHGIWKVTGKDLGKYLEVIAVASPNHRQGFRGPALPRDCTPYLPPPLEEYL